jgi:hypothetical protein
MKQTRLLYKVIRRIADAVAVVLIVVAVLFAARAF